MSVAAVCVDRARVLVKEPSARRIEGRTSFTPVAEQWFKCRLFLTQSNDVSDAQRAHFSSVSQPQVLCVKKDLDGTLLSFRGDQRLEINSKQFGRAVWRLMGEPEPLRKKRPIIGWLLFVERVIEREYDDLLNENVPPVYAPAL